MAETTKDHTGIEMKTHAPHVSVDFSVDEQIPSYFGRASQSRRRRANTWLISLFVILHLVVFAATMIVNDCSHNSRGDCALKPLGRFSFQPLLENPLLGPSASALEDMGALRQSFQSKHNKVWRLFTSPCLHAGVVHLIINLSAVIFVGIHLEQEFGAFRIGIIYALSAFGGSFIAALFPRDRPSVTSSGALLGLLGAMLAGIIRNWNLYSNKAAALVVIMFLTAINLVFGLLPYVNNFSNIGGFISGFLLGFMVLYSPQLSQMVQTKGGLFDYDIKCSVKLRQKLDKPVLRCVSLVLFSLLLAAAIVGVVRGVNLNEHCSWCQYIECAPSKWWGCSDKPVYCQSAVSSGRLTLTCMGSDKFRVFPFTEISEKRMNDLCNLICS